MRQWRQDERDPCNPGAIRSASGIGLGIKTTFKWTSCEETARPTGPSWGSWAEVKMSCWAPSPYITSCVAPRTTSSSSFKYPIKGPFRLVLMCLPWYISAPNIIGLCMLTHHTKKSYLRDKKWMNVCCFAIPSRRSLYIPLDFDKGNFNKYNFWKIFPLTLRPYSATRVAYRHARGAKISRDTRSISKGAINVMQRLYECLDA